MSGKARNEAGRAWWPAPAILLAVALGHPLAAADLEAEIRAEARAVVSATQALRGAWARAWKRLAEPFAGKPPLAREDVSNSELPGEEANVLRLHAAAVACEREACRRYAELLRVDARARGAWPDEVPAYPCPERAPLEEPEREEGDHIIDEPPSDEGEDELAALDEMMDEMDMEDADLEVDLRAIPDAAERLADLREIRVHIERIGAVVADAIGKRTATIPAPNAFTEIEDPLFGPWYGFAPLPGKDGVNRLPDGAGATGAQDWRYVDRWQVLGPLPLGGPGVRGAVLPYRFHLPRVAYPKRKLAISTKKGDVFGATGWRPFPVSTATGILRPPQWGRTTGSSYGSCICGTERESEWYAAATVVSDAERELWAAAGADDDAQLWVNDSLVAAWPDPAAREDLESPILFKLRLREGRNTVLARVRHVGRGLRKEQLISGFWLRICVRGAPRDAAAVAALERRLSDADVPPPFPPTVRGWRGNWRGVEPDAEPVTAWDMGRDLNVRWRCGAPPTISTPVVTGDHLLITADPYFLACLDKRSGELRWRHPIDVLELVAPAVAEEQRGPMAEYFDLYRLLHHRATGEGRGAGPPITYGGEKIARGAAWERCREIQKRFDRAIGAPLEKAGHVRKYLWMNYMGPICATPVTDGERVWAWTSMGAAACFDVAGGERRWLVELPHQGTSYGAFSSPLLVDGKLILEVVPDDSVRPGGKTKGGEFREVWLLALDAATGEERWRTRVYEPIGSASPVAMRLTDGEQEMAVIITGGTGTVEMTRSGEPRGCYLGGTVVRADDGEVLIENLSVNCGYATPVVVGDVVYHCGKGMMCATRLLMRGRDDLGAVRLWTRFESRGFEPCVSPWRGHLYADLAGGPGGQGDAGYAVYAADTGRQVARHVNLGWPLSVVRSSWGGSGRKYVMTAVAGGKVFCGDSGEAFGGKHLPHATFTVLEAGPQGRMLARNALPPRCNSSLAFDGDAIYFRNTNGVICLGRNGEPGEAYEAEVNARFVMRDLPTEAPAEAATTDVAPVVAGPRGHRPHGLWGRPRPRFFHTDPLPAGLGAELAGLVHGPALAASARVSHGKRSLRFKRDEEAYVFHEFVRSPHNWPKMQKRDGRVMGYAVHPKGFGKLDFTTAAPSQYYLVLLRSGAEQHVRFLRATDNPSVRAWLGGVPLTHQGRYRLERGLYVLLAEIETAEGYADAPDLCLDFRFVPAAADHAGDLAAYRDTLEAARSYLERVVALEEEVLRLDPDCETVERAKAVLARME